MKKLFSLLLILTLAFAFTACGEETPDADNTVTRIGYFAGTTGIGMAGMLANEEGKYEFKKYDGPTFITAALAKGDIDIAALPTNAVPNFYKNSNGSVQLLAINTLGVLHVCTNGTTVSTLSDLEGKTVYVPEQAPKLVLEYILREAGVNATVSLEYNLDLLPGAIAQGTVDVAVLPEPKVTVAQNMSKQVEGNAFAVSIDLTYEWNKVCDTDLVQGCVVVRKAFATEHPATVESFLSDYSKSISYVQNPANLDAVAAAVVEAGILPNAVVAKSAIPRSNITYMDGADMKAAAEGFYGALGMALPEDAFYYIPQN